MNICPRMLSYMFPSLRATTSVHANFLSILQEKTYFFLFYTFTFTKHSHQFIYSTHLFNKIFILFTFFIISFPLLSRILSQTQHKPKITHTQPATVFSTWNSKLDHGFSVIANMLKKIKPLDTSVVSKAVSDSAKDSMKQTISTMLGLLPSDQVYIIISISKWPNPTQTQNHPHLATNHH